MSHYQVEALLERMVPEFAAYRRHKLFSEAEIQALVKKRGAFERQLHYSVDPPLSVYMAYFSHLLATHTLARRKWARAAGEDGDAFPEENRPMQRARGVLNMMVRRRGADPLAWQTAVALCRKHGLQDKAGEFVAGYVRRFPETAEAWVYAALHVEETKGFGPARAVYQNAASCVDVEALPQRGHNGLAVGAAGTPGTAGTVDSGSTEALARHSPLEGIRKLYVNWILMELRQVRTLRGSVDSPGHLSDFAIDLEMAPESPEKAPEEARAGVSEASTASHSPSSPDQALRSILRGELATIVLRDGILAVAAAGLRGKVDKFSAIEALEKLDRGCYPSWFRRDYWGLYMLHSREELVHLQPVLSFLGEVYGVALVFSRQSGWADWWAARLVLEALDRAWEIAARVRSMPEFCDALPACNVRHPGGPIPISPLAPLTFAGPDSGEYAAYGRILESAREIGKYPEASKASGASAEARLSYPEAGRRAVDELSRQNAGQKLDLDQVLPLASDSGSGSEPDDDLFEEAL